MLVHTRRVTTRDERYAPPTLYARLPGGRRRGVPRPLARQAAPTLTLRRHLGVTCTTLADVGRCPRILTVHHALELILHRLHRFVLAPFPPPSRPRTRLRQRRRTDCGRARGYLDERSPARTCARMQRCGTGRWLAATPTSSAAPHSNIWACYARCLAQHARRLLSRCAQMSPPRAARLSSGVGGAVVSVAGVQAPILSADASRRARRTPSYPRVLRAPVGGRRRRRNYAGNLLPLPSRTRALRAGRRRRASDGGAGPPSRHERRGRDVALRHRRRCPRRAATNRQL